MTFRTALFMVFASATALTAVASIPAVENKGADLIMIYGGSRGDVPFPHYQHQDSLKDCNICHATFPQEEKAIEAMKQKGAIKQKYVMNKLCTSCHRKMKKAGEKTGPTSCKECHKKD